MKELNEEVNEFEPNLKYIDKIIKNEVLESNEYHFDMHRIVETDIDPDYIDYNQYLTNQ